MQLIHLEEAILDVGIVRPIICYVVEVTRM